MEGLDHSTKSLQQSMLPDGSCNSVTITARRHDIRNVTCCLIMSGCPELSQVLCHPAKLDRAKYAQPPFPKVVALVSQRQSAILPFQPLCLRIFVIGVCFFYVSAYREVSCATDAEARLITFLTKQVKILV
jgi:hypothetical protein